MNAQPGLIRRALLALAGVLVAAILAIGAWQGYRAALAQPLRQVVFAGDLDRLPHRDLDALARSVQESGTASLESVRQAARSVPWVRDASVRRRWPDTVEVRFEAYDAVARWNDDRLVSSRGEIFVAETSGSLPRLRGPDAAAATMAREHPAIAAALQPLGTPIAELRMSPRGAWQAVMASGLVLDIGRGDVLPRVQRFAAAWPQLKDVETKHADLRYTNGFALRAARATPTPTK